MKAKEKRKKKIRRLKRKRINKWRIEVDAGVSPDIDNMVFKAPI